MANMPYCQQNILALIYIVTSYFKKYPMRHPLAHGISFYMPPKHHLSVLLSPARLLHIQFLPNKSKTLTSFHTGKKYICQVLPTPSEDAQNALCKLHILSGFFRFQSSILILPLGGLPPPSGVDYPPLGVDCPPSGVDYPP